MNRIEHDVFCKYMKCRRDQHFYFLGAWAASFSPQKKVYPGQCVGRGLCPPEVLRLRSLARLPLSKVGPTGNREGTLSLRLRIR